MEERVYFFDINNAFTFYKAGHFFATEEWKHKDIVNRGDYEFMIVISGCIYISIGGKEYAVKEHECIMIPPYIRHFGYKESDPGSNHFWLHFFPSGQVNSTTNVYTQTVQFEKNYDRVYVPVHFKLPHFEKIAVLCKQLLDCSNDRYCSPLTANFIVTSITIELSNQYLKLIRQDIQKMPSKFEIICNWIRIHSHEALNVSYIAEKFSITPEYLTRQFKKYKNTTTNKYINKLKIEQAEELLLTSEKSIKDIALELSFTNEKYFMRVFKQFHGITPTEFRNSYPKTYFNNITVDPSIPMPSIMMHSKDGSSTTGE